MISILHTADWQIGRVFAQFEPDDAAALFEARFSVVERLASIATDRGVDAILVAGDVFDAQTVTEKTIRRLFNAMQGFTGTWVLMPGNHDAALVESVWSRARRLGVIPRNVIVCLDPKPVVVAGKFNLLPAPLTQRHTYATSPTGSRQTFQPTIYRESVWLQRGGFLLHRFAPSYACVRGFCRRWRGHCDRLSTDMPWWSTRLWTAAGAARVDSLMDNPMDRLRLPTGCPRGYPHLPTAAPVCEPTSRAMFYILNAISNPTCECSRHGDLSGSARTLHNHCDDPRQSSLDLCLRVQPRHLPHQ